MSIIRRSTLLLVFAVLTSGILVRQQGSTEGSKALSWGPYSVSEAIACAVAGWIARGSLELQPPALSCSCWQLHRRPMESAHQMEKFRRLWEGGHSLRALLASHFKEGSGGNTHTTFFFSSVPRNPGEKNGLNE